jgi:hypothetical protein
MFGREVGFDYDEMTEIYHISYAVVGDVLDQFEASSATLWLGLW